MTVGIFDPARNYRQAEVQELDPKLYKTLYHDWMWQPGDAPVARRRASMALFDDGEDRCPGALLNAAR